MANRKATVVNPAGYQEQLPDTDNLVLAAAPTEDSHGANKKYVDEATLDPNTGESIYVEVSGDNMTGNLTLGIDKIVLGVSGSAAFGGSSISSDALGVYLNDGNVSSWNTASTNLWTGFTAGNTTPTSTINGGGSATFGSGNIALNSNGSATFAGSVTSTPASGAAFYAYNGGTSSENAILISSTSDGSGLKTFLKYDGSATFAKDVQVGGDPISATRDLGVRVRPMGLLQLSRETGKNAIEIFKPNADDPLATITADGAATFAGPLEAASIDGGTY